MNKRSEYLKLKKNLLKTYSLSGNGGCYCIENTETNKIYIGSSNNIDARINIHKLDLSFGFHGNYLLQEDWNRFGEKSFSFTVLWECDSTVDKNEILFMEQILINKHIPEYNIKKKVDYIDYNPPLRPSYSEKDIKYCLDKINKFKGNCFVRESFVDFLLPYFKSKYKVVELGTDRYKISNNKKYFVIKTNTMAFNINKNGWTKIDGGGTPSSMLKYFESIIK